MLSKLPKIRIVSIGVGAALVSTFLAACSVSVSTDGSNPPSGSTKIVTEIQKVDGSPFEVANCDAATIPVKDEKTGNVNTHLYLYMQIKNTSNQEIQDANLYFVNYTADGKPAGDGKTTYKTADFTLDGKVPANEVAHAEYTFEHMPADLGKITCSPNMVTLADGKKWNRPTATAVSSTNTDDNN